MRVYNFSAGPGTLPPEVLERVRKHLIDYDGTGMSVMEMSHRSKPYMKINDKTEELLRELMGVPDGYDILFVQGGATNQFSAVPLNIGTVNRKADYVVTGNFSKIAYKEGAVHLDAAIAASSEDKNFTYIPDLAPSMFRRDADFVHICYNNTIFGTRYTSVPDTDGIPLVCDMFKSGSQRFRLRAYLCGRAKKHRSGGRDRGYSPSRSYRSRRSQMPRNVAVRQPGQKQKPVQHPALLFDLRCYGSA